MIPFVRACLCLLLLISYSVSQAASIFHSYISDISPPYMCYLKLKSAKGVSIEDRHLYQFSGICSVKIPIGNSWIYQNVWVDTLADWNSRTNEGFETTTLYNNLGTIVAQVKCDDDPWVTKAQCSLVGYQNNTQFTNFGGVYNPRMGQYPPFETSTGQYPPLARNQAILQEAVALSVWSARQEAQAAHAQFLQTFGEKPQTTTTTVTTNVTSTTTNSKSKHVNQIHTFKNPQINKLRLDWCLMANKNCGKTVADRFCQTLGYREARTCKVEPGRLPTTIFIGTLTICHQANCRGFEEIECVK